MTKAQNSAMAGIASTAVNASKKAENYTAEQTVAIVAAYAGGKGKAPAELATQYGKTEKSIVAKLSREGVYVKKARVSKVTGGDPINKEEIVTEIAAIMGVTEDKLSGLEKATKQCLLLIKGAFETAAVLLADSGDSEAADAANVTFAAEDAVKAEVGGNVEFA